MPSISIVFSIEKSNFFQFSTHCCWLHFNDLWVGVYVCVCACVGVLCFYYKRTGWQQVSSARLGSARLSWLLVLPATNCVRHKRKFQGCHLQPLTANDVAQRPKVQRWHAPKHKALLLLLGLHVDLTKDQHSNENFCHLRAKFAGNGNGNGNAQNWTPDSGLRPAAQTPPWQLLQRNIDRVYP